MITTLIAVEHSIEKLEQHSAQLIPSVLLNLSRALYNVRTPSVFMSQTRNILNILSTLKRLTIN
jgi:predicted fused transcriptional regulator/phosphomethylpyrimidine kinase